MFRIFEGCFYLTYCDGLPSQDRLGFVSSTKQLNTHTHSNVFFCCRSKAGSRFRIELLCLWPKKWLLFFSSAQLKTGLRPHNGYEEEGKRTKDLGRNSRARQNCLNNNCSARRCFHEALEMKNQLECVPAALTLEEEEEEQELCPTTIAHTLSIY